MPELSPLEFLTRSRTWSWWFGGCARVSSLQRPAELSPIGRPRVRIFALSLLRLWVDVVRNYTVDLAFMLLRALAVLNSLSQQCFRYLCLGRARIFPARRTAPRLTRPSSRSHLGDLWLPFLLYIICFHIIVMLFKLYDLWIPLLLWHTQQALQDKISGINGSTDDVVVKSLFVSDNLLKFILHLVQITAICIVIHVAQPALETARISYTYMHSPYKLFSPRSDAMKWHVWCMIMPSLGMEAQVGHGHGRFSKLA